MCEEVDGGWGTVGGGGGGGGTFYLPSCLHCVITPPPPPPHHPFSSLSPQPPVPSQPSSSVEAGGGAIGCLPTLLLEVIGHVVDGVCVSGGFVYARGVE